MPGAERFLGGRQPVNNTRLQRKYFSAALNSFLTAVKIMHITSQPGWQRLPK